MGARKDFAIIHHRAFSDKRVVRMGHELAARKVGKGDLTHLLAVGIIAALSDWLTRHGNDGVLPGDGLLPIREATAASRRDAEAIRDIMLSDDVALLSRCEDGLYLKGFLDAYGPLLKKRAYNAGRTSEQRSDNVATTLPQGSTPTVAVAVTEAVAEEKTHPPIAPPSEDDIFSSAPAPSSAALHQELRMRNLNGRGGCGTRFWLDSAEHCIKAGATAKALLVALDASHPNAGPREVWAAFFPASPRGRALNLPETNGSDEALRRKYAAIEGRA